MSDTDKHYDHNQTLVPDSFVALWIRNGRPSVDRVELERLFERAEGLALYIADRLAVAPVDEPDAQRQALRLCKNALVAETAQISAAQAGWIGARAAELLGWSPDTAAFESFIALKRE